MRPADDRALLAAANNADLYELVFRAHGVAFRRDSSMFVSGETPPPYYSSMTTLDPDATGRQILEIEKLKVDRDGSFGLKDGFCRLDLEGDGFRVLFEACWIWAAADRFASPPLQDWVRVATPQALATWEEAWSASSPTEQRLFPNVLLYEPAIAFFGRRSGNGFDAGCIANRSHSSVGLSNVFGIEQNKSLYSVAACLAVDFAHGQPVVGYEKGKSLQAMLDGGFEAVGPLRVWVIESS